MLAALRHLVFRRLYLAQIVALAGTGLATVALSLIAYRIAPESAAGVLGTALAIKMLAYVFVAPVVTALVTRLPRRSVLVAADVIRAAAALCLPFVASVWQIYALVFILQAASATFTPTFQSVIPDVLPDEEEFTAALSLSRLAYDLEAVVSPMLAAALLLVIPASALFIGTGLGFVASAMIVVGTAIPWPRGETSAPPQRERIGAAIGRFVRTPALRPILAINAAVAFAGAFILVQTVVVVRTTFGLGDDAVALLLAANGAGSMTVALTLPRLLRRIPERRAMLTGALIVGCAVALAPIALYAGGIGGAVTLGVLWFVAGAGWSAAETPVGRVIRNNVDPDQLAGAFAAQFSLSHACWLLAYPLAGWLAVMGTDTIAWILAGVSLTATVIATALWPTPAPVDMQ